MMAEEHPFAAYVRILGRGRTNSRSLTEDEAETAMTMILAGDVLPEQLGAFLMLLRVKEETAAEVAGFVRGARKSIELPDPPPGADLDWSSYAGKRRQLPWFLLAALTLAGNGVRVFMHGIDGHTPGRIYTRAALEALGLTAATSFAEVAAGLDARNFAYLPLANFSPRLDEIINLRSVLGLRSPAHTIARMLNPLAAPHLLQGIFHPGFMETHQQAALLLGQPRMAVFRGEGGEIERRPNKPTEVRIVEDGRAGVDAWPRLLDAMRQAEDSDMDVGRLAGVWRGDIDDGYATSAITGTLAIALKLLGRAGGIEEAEAGAAELWRARDKNSMGAPGLMARA